MNRAKSRAWPSAPLQHVFGDERIAAVILSQQLIGKKVWTK